jgi:geranylgeranyl pyrophosphate synthase
MEGMNLTTLFGGGAIIISSLYFLFQSGGIGKIKKLFSKNQKDLENKIEELQIKEKEQIIKIQEKEKIIEEKKEKVKEFVEQAKKEIEETGNINNTKKLLEEFNKW